MAGFRVERAGERVRGSAAGVDARVLRELAAGERSPERRLDLHGLTRAEAREDLAFELAEAQAEGERCVLVVTGRGTHSALGPVLRDAVVEWLQQPPLAERVLAFASARPRDGGSGALYVLLRRMRGPGRRDA